MMNCESSSRKIMYAIHACIWFLFCGVCGGLYLAWWSNSKELDSAICGVPIKKPEKTFLCHRWDDKYYDNMYMLGPYSNAQLADDYINDLENWDQDIVNKGSRFSIVYSLCGFTLALLALSNFCLMCGAWNLYARMCGLCCAFCLGCVNFAALITTGVFRYNTMGKLAALSLVPTKYDAET